MRAEYINGIPRYCLWMDGADPAALLKLPLVRERVGRVHEIRLQSKKAAIQKKAATPWLFDEVRPSKGDSYIAAPSVSSSRRKYVPMGFVSNGMIPGNKLFFISDGGLYEFGILESQFQNAWMRLVAGRLKSDYNYSNTIVYNNFVWSDATPEQLSRIEACAQAALDARAAHPDATLVKTYDPDNCFLFPATSWPPTAPSTPPWRPPTASTSRATRRRSSPTSSSSTPRRPGSPNSPDMHGVAPRPSAACRSTRRVPAA